MIYRIRGKIGFVNWCEYRFVVMYLTAILIANLDIIWFQNIFGTTAQARMLITSLNAFLFIGLDLSARDSLHEAWHNNGLVWKMIGLIASGSILSFLLKQNAGQIAMASFLAFSGSGLADTIVYSILGSRAKLVKMNGSNLVSGAVDSVLFPAIAFGLPLLWPVMIGQFLAKTLGGGLWSLILVRLKTNA